VVTRDTQHGHEKKGNINLELNMTLHKEDVKGAPTEVKAIGTEGYIGDKMHK
jgi:hypothetical protein